MLGGFQLFTKFASCNIAIHGNWITANPRFALPAGMTDFVTFVYNDERGAGTIGVCFCVCFCRVFSLVGWAKAWPCPSVIAIVDGFRVALPILQLVAYVAFMWRSGIVISKSNA